MRNEPLIALPISSGIRMLAAVHLDDQPLFATDKIANVRSDWLLPHKLGASDLPIAQSPPKLFLGIRLIDAQPT